MSGNAYRVSLCHSHTCSLLLVVAVVAQELVAMYCPNSLGVTSPTVMKSKDMPSTLTGGEEHLPGSAQGSKAVQYSKSNELRVVHV